MKELKFRGLTKENKFVYGYYFLWKKRNKVLHMIGEGVQKGSIYGDEVDPETISQDTGLKDVYGKKIFEGDILSFDFSEDHKNKDYSKPIYVVQLFKDVFPCATGIHDNLYAHWHRLPFTKVLGNIHQNSELLEKNK